MSSINENCLCKLSEKELIKKLINLLKKSMRINDQEKQLDALISIKEILDHYLE
jgi:hypothetical protein